MDYLRLTEALNFGPGGRDDHYNWQDFHPSSFTKITPSLVPRLENLQEEARRLAGEREAYIAGKGTGNDFDVTDDWRLQIRPRHETRSAHD